MDRAAGLRAATKVGLFPSPLTVDQAMDRVDAWLGADPAVVLVPTSDHARLVRTLLTAIGSERNLVNDAQVAALSIEHRCGIVSFDTDFGRFPGVRWQPPPA